MAQEKNITKKDIQNNLKKITDTVDIDMANKIIELSGGFENDFQLTKRTLTNIAKWALDGKSQHEIQANLELSDKEWKYLCRACPAILLVMQHSMAYADLVVAGTLYQTAIGGHTIKRKVPIKIKEYDNGRVIGEHIEYAEYDEVQPANPYLLKYLAENKLSENFGKTKIDNSKEHREVVDIMSDNELAMIESLGNKDAQ